MGPDRGRRVDVASGRSLAGDRRGQQFVLEVAVVAILVASTVVLVTSFTPTQPGIEDPRTHERTATEAQDILDALAAESVSRCTTVAVEGADGETVDREICPGRQRLDRLIVADLLGNTARTCKEISDQVGPGKEVAVVLHGSIREQVLCGDLPPVDEPTASQAAFATTVLRFNYTHTFTDLDRYNGNDPTAEGKQITSDGSVHTEEARAWQRVTTVPTRMSWPVVPKGDAVEAEVNVQGGAVGGNQTLQAAGSTEESADGGLEYASFYGEHIPWCPEGWNSADFTCINDDGGDERDDAPHLEDDATYDWKLDGRYFGDPPFEPNVKFKVRINETAGAPIENGTRLACKIPPDWAVDDVDVPADSPDVWKDVPDPTGSRKRGWSIEATTDQPINTTNATLRITATPPNPSNTDSSDDPKRPVYVFRCWLENDADSVLDIPVDLKPSDVTDLPITSGVIATVSPASGMDTDGEGWWGVSVINPTSESLDVTEVRVESLSKTALFSRLNRSVARPEGTWEVVGLQGSKERIRNGHFELGTDLGNLTGSKIPEWSTETWAPDPDRPTAVATDGRGLPHVVYSRAKDGQLVHAWQQLTARGRPNWTRELLSYHGRVDAESVVVDDRGTPDRTSDDRVLVFAVAPKDKNEDPDDYDEPSARFHLAQTHPPPEGSDPGDNRVVLLSRPMDGTWDAQHLSDADLVSSMSAEVGNGSWWLSYAVWDDDDPRILVQRNLTTEDTCEGIGRVNWDCREVVSDGEPDHVSTVWNGSSLKMLYQEVETSSNLEFCAFPCNVTVTLGDAHIGNATVDLALGSNETLHAAWISGGSSYVSYAERSAVCPAESIDCWEIEQAVGSKSGSLTSLGVGLVDNGTRPEIAYATEEDGVRRVRRTGSGTCQGGDPGWSCETIDADGSEALSAVADDRGTLHVSYVVPTDSGADQLRYANSRMGTGDWSFWPGARPSGGSTEVGGSIDAAVGDDGTVHVVYQDEGTSSLRYARTTPNGSWAIDVVETGPPMTGWRSAVTTIGNEPVIAYYTESELRYATRSGSSDGNCGLGADWDCRSVAPISYDEPSKTDVAIENLDGEAVILFHDQTGGLSVAFQESLVSTDTCPSSDAEWQCAGVRDSSGAFDPDAVAYNGSVHVVWQVNDHAYYANVSKGATDTYESGAGEAFDTRDKSGIASQITAGTLDGTDRLWVMEAASKTGGLPTTDQNELKETDCCDGGGGSDPETHSHALDFRLATKPAADQTPLGNYSTSDDDCLDGDTHPDWACRDFGYTDGEGGRGDLVFADGELHGVYPHGPIYYFTTKGTGCPQDTNHSACQAISPKGGSKQAEEATAAIVVKDGTPWIFFEPSGSNALEVAKMSDGDRDCPNAPTWNCEVVDPGEGIPTSGIDPAVALDRLGRAHVTHRDPANRDLLYSIRTSTQWSTERVDTGTAPLGVGEDVEADWDAAGDRHLAYKVKGSKRLWYATDAGGSWGRNQLFTDIDHHDLHVANDTVHLLLSSEGDGSGGEPRLVYARCGNAAQGGCVDPGNWSWQNVSGCVSWWSTCNQLQITTLSNGTVQIAYTDPYDLYTATYAQGRNSTCREPSTTGWRCELFDVGSAYRPTVTVRPDDRLGLAYVDQEDHDHLTLDSDHYKVQYAERSGGEWTSPETVVMHDAGLAGTDKRLSYDLDLAYTPADEPRIAYRTSDYGAADDLRIARRDDGSWSTSVVETRSDTLQGYRHQTLLTLDDGRVVVLYERTGSDTLRMAHETSSGSCSGGDEGWSCETLRDLSGLRRIHAMRRNTSIHTILGPTNTDPPVAFSNASGAWTAEALPTEHGRTSGDVGFYSDIVLTDARTAGGRVTSVPHVSFHDAGNGSVKYATKKDGSWQVETVDETSDAGLFTSIAHDGSGPMIAYLDRFNDELRFAHKDAGSWRVERVNGTGTFPSRGYVDLRIGPRGLPTIVHQIDTDDGPALGLARRSLPNATSCGAGMSANWSCTILDQVTGSPTGIWSSLAVPEGIDAIDDRSILHRRTDATGTSVVRLTNDTATDNGCSEWENWTCADLSAAGSGPAYPSVAADPFGGHVGLFLDSGVDDISDATLRFPGVWDPIPSDVVEVTDRVDPGVEVCLQSGWRCRTVLSDRPVARPDVTMVGSKAHAVLEDATKRTFLYGTSHDWGRATVIGGINASIVDQSVGDRAVRLERTFDDRTWDHEADALTQTFAVGADRNLSAALLEFDWRKSIAGDNRDLALDTFGIRVDIDRLDDPAGPTAVWSHRSLEGYDDDSTVRIPVTDLVGEPGSYELRIILETRGKMLRSGSSATVQVTLDEVSLRTFENRQFQLDNPRFDDPDDWIGYYNASGDRWDLADDGGWTGDDIHHDPRSRRWGDVLVEHDYGRTWNASARPGGGGGREDPVRYAATEFIHAVDWGEGNGQTRQDVPLDAATAYHQNFTLSLDDGELPSAVTIDAGVFEQGTTVVGGAQALTFRDPNCEADADQDGDGISAGLVCWAEPDEESAGPAPSCTVAAEAEDDPCSSFATGEAARGRNGASAPAGTAISSGQIRVNATLKSRDDDATTTHWMNRSMSSDSWDCENGCRLGPWDVSGFVEDRGPDARNYTLTLEVSVDYTAEEPVAGANWSLYQITAGVDSVLVSADYGGGTAMRWRGHETVPERSSQDWVFRVIANGEETFAGGDRVRVDTSYENGYATEALHMPRYGLYQVDVRPENATCDPLCQGHGGGYDIDVSACVTAGVGRARAAAKGRACYVNDPNATLTRGIEQAVRDKSITEVVGGEGRFNTFPARDPDGSCNHARVNWNFTKVRDAYNKAAGELDLDVSVGKVHLTLHSPAYGAPVWTAIEPELSGTERIPLCELFFEGAHVLEAELPVTVEAPVEELLGNGTTVEVQTARKADYFTVVPRERQGDDGLTRGLPAVGVELRTWWRSG